MGNPIIVNTLFKAIGMWGAPIDLPAKIACALALAVLVLSFASKEPRFSKREAVLGATVASAFVSLLYAALYLRGGPRIIDSTAYFLEARALSEGHLTFSTALPSASFRGRFLFFNEGHLGVLFPPGYPLLLAIGFLFRAPLVIGPLTAAALTFATAKLAEEFADAANLGKHRDTIAKGAAFFSLVSAALRYHTADTMSHAATALGITLSFYFALRARHSASRFATALSGLALGFVISARPVSAVAPFAVLLFLLYRSSARRALPWFLVGIVPFALLLLAAQHANTGHFFSSVQRAYYAAADGPSNCFRYGFGKQIGCLNEHGDFVRAHLASGYGFVEALGTTLRRLKLHLLDVANFEPLALVVLFALRPKSIVTRAALALVGLHMLAYAPFYFDGNYPGGGGRIFIDIVPVEHALLPIALLSITRGEKTIAAASKLASAAIALALLGFGVHAAYAHNELKNRDGGQPMFDQEVVRKIDLNYGILFFDTDHGWNLAFDPDNRPKEKIVAARMHKDDHDRLLYTSLGKPPAFVYTYAPNGEAKITPWPIPKASDTWHFEAEAEWPPLAQTGGYATPSWPADGCAHGSRVLTLRPDPNEESASATLALPIPKNGRWSVRPRVYVDENTNKSSLFLTPTAQWTWDKALGKGCHELAEAVIEAEQGEKPLIWSSTQIAHLDEIVVKKVE